jgi:hypothetical protein
MLIVATVVWWFAMLRIFRFALPCCLSRPRWALPCGMKSGPLIDALSLFYWLLVANLAAAESRIRDADLAMEAANLTKAQILQQARIAALAQANAAPQVFLSLLCG